MTITVSAPGGISIDFPEGTDQETIRRVMLRATGGDGSEARPAPAKPSVSTAEALGRGALQGATFGFSDEIYAGARGAYDALRGGSFGPTYDRELADVRAANERAKAEAPYAYLGGEVAGGLALPLGAAGTAVRGATMAARTAQSAKVGATLGGLYGVGTAEGGDGTLAQQTANRLTSAIPSAVLGGAIGAAGPAAVDVASAALRYPANAIRAYRNPSATADAKVIEALARDAPDTMAASQAVMRAQDRLGRAQATKPEMMLADVGGQNTRDLLRTATNMPSKGAERLRKTLDQRQAWQWSRIEKDVADTLADGNAFAQSVDEVTKRVSEVGKETFDLAFSRPWNVKANDPLAVFLQRPYVAKIMDRTRENIVGMTGQDVATLRPWEFMHRVKMQIDREIGAAKRASHPDGWNTRDLVTLKREMVELMGKHNGPYRAALYKYGDEAGIRNALEQGFDEFKGTSPDQLRKTLAGLSEPERRMYRIGAARSLFDDIERGNVTRDRTDALFSSPAIQMKLAALYPDVAARREMQRRLVLEARMADTRKAVQGGSTTARQLAQGAEAGQPVEAMTSLANATSGNLRPAMAWLSRQMQMFNGMTPQVADQVIDRLMQRTPPSLHVRLMAEIQRAAREPAQRDELVRRIIQGSAPVAGDNTGAPQQRF